MKNVKIILLLSVFISFFCFVKINEGFGLSDLSDIYGYLTGADDTGKTGDELLRENTKLYSDSPDDAVRNLNSMIDSLPDATMVYPKDPVEIINFGFLTKDLGNGTTISHTGSVDKNFPNILKENGSNVNEMWEYQIYESTDTPELNIIDPSSKEIQTGMDLVYLSGCSEIITGEQPDSPLTCHTHTRMSDCNSSDNCVWDALCEQPHRPVADIGKMYTPKECILNNGIFRTDLLHYAKNSVIGGKISTSFNLKEITDIWSRALSNRLPGQNDSDSCSIEDKSPKITESYLNHTCYPPIVTGFMDSDFNATRYENITTKDGGLLLTENPYNTPQNFFDFKHNDHTCNWSSKMDNPGDFSKCFNTDINYNELPQTGWESYTCSKWDEDKLENCSTNDEKTRVNENIIGNSNDDNDTLKDYCCSPQKTCTNIDGVELDSPDISQFPCHTNKVLNVNAETCSEEGCSEDFCCVPNTTCGEKGQDCSGDYQIKTATKCYTGDNSVDLCDDFQGNCCEEYPLCRTQFLSENDCADGYYLNPDISTRCSTSDCTDDGNCCIIKATCGGRDGVGRYECDEGYTLNESAICPTGSDSCNHGICCEPQPTCSDTLEQVTCPVGKIFDENKIYEDHNEDGTADGTADGNGACCIDDIILCADPSPTGVLWDPPESKPFGSGDTRTESCDEESPKVWTYSGDIKNSEIRQDIQLGLKLKTPPRTTCGHYSDETSDDGHCPPGQVFDRYKPCSGDSCDPDSEADHCCKPDTYFCKGPNFSTDGDSNVIYQNAGDPPPSGNSQDLSCLSDTLTDFVWQTCSQALSELTPELTSYPYIGNLFQVCGLEPPSLQSRVGDAHIPSTLDTQPTCSHETCQGGQVMKSLLPPICSNNPCTVEDCCEDDTCANFLQNNPGICNNRQNDTSGQCEGECDANDCCVDYVVNINDINSYVSAGLTILGFSSDRMVQNNSIFTSVIDLESKLNNLMGSCGAASTQPDSPCGTVSTQADNPEYVNKIELYVKGHDEDNPTLNNLISYESITEIEQTVLTFVIVINEISLNPSVTYDVHGFDTTATCGEMSGDKKIYKIRFHTGTDNKLHMTTSSITPENTTPENTTPENINTIMTVHQDDGNYKDYILGEISLAGGNHIQFDINNILTDISSKLGDASNGGSNNSFEEIIVRLLELRTKDIFDIFISNHTDSTLTAPAPVSHIAITRTRNGVEENLLNKLCQLDVDINGHGDGRQWSVNSIVVNKSLNNRSFGIDNFIQYESTINTWGVATSGGPTINTHFEVCSGQKQIRWSQPNSLIIRIKELLLTAKDIYDLYNEEPAQNFTTEPRGCNSTDITDGNIFSDEEADTINRFIRTLIPWIDIRNLHYTSNKLYYNDVDKVTMTISEI